MDLELFKNPIVIWFAVGLVLFLLELANPGLIILFFAIGAWVTALAQALFDLSFDLQLVVFIISSILSLLLLRRWLKKVFSGYERQKGDPESILDEFAGHKAVVLEEIRADRDGTVEFKGVQWQAAADETIPAGTTVRIVRKDNLTLTVKKIV